MFPLSCCYVVMSVYVSMCVFSRSSSPSAVSFVRLSLDLLRICVRMRSWSYGFPHLFLCRCRMSAVDVVVVVVVVIGRGPTTITANASPRRFEKRKSNNA